MRRILIELLEEMIAKTFAFDKVKYALNLTKLALRTDCEVASIIVAILIARARFSRSILRRSFRFSFRSSRFCLRSFIRFFISSVFRLYILINEFAIEVIFDSREASFSKKLRFAVSRSNCFSKRRRRESIDVEVSHLSIETFATHLITCFCSILRCLFSHI